VTDGGPQIVLRAGGASDVGRVRTVNEDRLLISERVFAVADGMGGHAAGEVAAQLALETLEIAMGPTTEDLVDAVKVANEAVIQRSARDPNTRGMGTTLCAVAIVEVEPEAAAGDTELVAVVNVGDSRAYIYQGGELLQLTEDHSLVEEMVREGRLSPEEAHAHPSRNIVTRSIGNEPNVNVDVWEISVRAGDRFLLCSDGLFNELDDDQIAAVLRRLEDPEEAAVELVRLANEAGGRDNITVLVVDVVDDAGRGASDAAAVEGEARVGRHDDHPPGAPGEDGDTPRAGRAATATATGARRFTRPSLTWRTAVFLVALVAVVGGAFAVIDWYGGSGWFVGVDDGHVAVFRGRPGGVLWVDPELEERTSLRLTDVPPARRDDLESGKEVADREEAERFVENLRDEAERLGVATTTTTTTSTTAPIGGGSTDTTAATPTTGG
jgi:serine/threonine protein phosphatase PrpC